MSSKNEVFEYLIDQLRQQVTKKDVISFNVSVRISDLDDVKQVIHNLQQHIAGKDDEIRALKDSLRQQVNNSPYKQQCEDLAHEVQSLKNQLRDASARIKELTCALDCAENEVMCLRSIVDLDPKGAIGYIRRANSAMTDILRRQYLSKALEELGCKDAPEQSGRRKEDTQGCGHDWVLDEKGDYFVCAKCGEQEAELVDCRHTNTVGLRKGFAPGFTKKCLDCGAKLK
jgi:DNA repair exonuclease SbcCD ATPase subunit